VLLLGQFEDTFLQFFGRCETMRTEIPHQSAQSLKTQSIGQAGIVQSRSSLGGSHMILLLVPSASETKIGSQVPVLQQILCLNSKRAKTHWSHAWKSLHIRWMIWPTSTSLLALSLPVVVVAGFSCTGRSQNYTFIASRNWKAIHWIPNTRQIGETVNSV